MFRHYILSNQRQILVNLRQATHITQAKNRIVFSMASSHETNGALIFGSGGSDSAPTEIEINYENQEEAKQEMKQIQDSLILKGRLL